MFGEALVRSLLRCCAPAFRDAWSADVQQTYREGGLAVRHSRGRGAFVWYALTNWLDLVRAAWRSRRQSSLPITADHSPRQFPGKDFGMRSLVHDIWNACRRLIREPRAAAGSVLLLALAIGVTSAMFAVIDAFMVRPAPFRDPGTLAQLAIRRDAGISTYLDFPTTRALRDSGVFDAVMPVIMNAVGEFERGSGVVVRSGAHITPGTFASLGVSPLLGREFVSGEGREGNDRYILLSEPAWRELFDANPSVIGTTVEVSGVSTVVVGVMPGGMRFPIRGDGIWRPLDLDAPSAATATRRLTVHVRRQASMPVAEAERLASDTVDGLLGEPGRLEFRDTAAGLLDPYSRESLMALAIGVGLVFVVLCANVTNLILARTTVRRQEFGVCTALGASRGRLMRQVFLENAAVGIGATLLGLGLAYALVTIGQRTLPQDLMWRTLNPLDLDWRAVAATSVVGMLAVMLAGLPSAWFGTSADANASISLASRGGTDTPGSRRLTQSLLVVEVAMAVALLAAAGLQVRSFLNLMSADRGLDANRVVIATAPLPRSLFADKDSRAVVAQLIEDRVRALPGVAAVTLASNMPPDQGNIHFSFEVRTDVPDSPPIAVNMMHSYYVAPAFFDAFGIRLREGRGFEVTDTAEAAVLSEGLARQLFPGQSAVGHTFTFGKSNYHVVGVATEIRNSLTDPREDYPEFYRPWYSSGVPGAETVKLGIRCGDPCASPESVRQAIASVSAAVDAVSIHQLSDDFRAQLARPRVAAIVAAMFAGLALFATGAGLYGVLSYLVSRRRREFGIRAALALPAMAPCSVATARSPSMSTIRAASGSAMVLSPTTGRPTAVTRCRASAASSAATATTRARPARQTTTSSPAATPDRVSPCRW
jgi:predicted permease